MRYARIEDGIVVNVEEWPDDHGVGDLIQSDTANVGDFYVDGEFIRPEPPTPDHS